MFPIITISELSQLPEKSDFVLVDASAGKDAQANYLKAHLENAYFVDLEKDLAEVPDDAALGGRHPLPDIDSFANLLVRLGITPSSHVVVYDDKAGANAAARFWWMLRAVGYDKVQVLSGGLQAAMDEGYPVQSGGSEPVAPVAVERLSWKLPSATIDEVAMAALDDTKVVIDVRDAYRYNGESEPIDLIAGHIPGAINIPFTYNLDGTGLFKPETALREQYRHLFEKRAVEDVIVHCGSGVTACHTLLSIAAAGFGVPTLYVGSWSEWSRNDKPVGKNLV